MAEEQTFTKEELDAAVAEQLTDMQAKVDEFRTTNIGLMKKLDGFDPDETATLKAKVAEMEQAAEAAKAGVSAEEVEKLSTKIRKNLEEEYAGKLSDFEKVQLENRTLKFDDKAKVLLGKNGVRAERIDDLWNLRRGHFDLTDDGAIVVTDGKPGKDPEKYVAEDLLAEYPEFFNGTGSSGGGASKSAGGAGGAATHVARGDNDAFLANLDGIADGSVDVR